MVQYNWSGVLDSVLQPAAGMQQQRQQQFNSVLDSLYGHFRLFLLVVSVWGIVLNLVPTVCMGIVFLVRGCMGLLHAFTEWKILLGDRRKFAC
jgi:hypothetical protein